ncbi:MAG: C25 family cysteine peptidase, partial [Bacteroidales bacterium]|nr:C25 family cysteine peptidase [Bacteroidales bacterium]
MKNTHLIHYLLLFTILGSSINSSGEIGDFSLNINGDQNMYTDDEESYQVLLNNIQFPESHPNMLAYSALVLIPNGADVNITTYVNGFVTYSWGEPDPVPTIPGNQLLKDPIIYNSTDDYPGFYYKLKRLGKIRGQEMAVLYMYPYQFDPVNDIVKRYDFTLDISFSGEIESLPMNLISSYDPTIPHYQNFDPTITHAINYDQIIKLEQPLKSANNSTTNFEEGCDLIVITVPDLEATANSLKEHKENIGLTTTIKTFESPSTAELEEYINECFEKMDPVPTYILLLGDTDIIPTFDMGGTNSDLPYFDLDDEAPFLPDFSYGRIPVSNITDAQICVNKIISYESKNSNDAFFSNAGLISFFKGVTSGGDMEHRRYIKSVEDVNRYLQLEEITSDRLYHSEHTNIQYYTNVTEFMFHGERGKQSMDGEIIRKDKNKDDIWDNLEGDVVQSVNNGKFLMIYRGHGSNTSIGYDSYVQLQNSSVNDLNNSENPSVFFLISCLAGDFAISGDCLAEKLLTHEDGGAVGVIAATQLTDTRYNDYFLRGLMGTIWTDYENYLNHKQVMLHKYGHLRMGDVVRSSKLYLSTLNSDHSDNQNPDEIISLDPHIQSHIFSYHWLGDPTLQILPSPDICIPEQIISNLTVSDGEERVFEKTENVFVQGNNTLNAGSSVKISAGKINISPGFKVNRGAKFKVRLEHCPENPEEINQKQSIDIENKQPGNFEHNNI